MNIINFYSKNVAHLGTLVYNSQTWQTFKTYLHTMHSYMQFAMPSLAFRSITSSRFVIFLKAKLQAVADVFVALSVHTHTYSRFFSM